MHGLKTFQHCSFPLNTSSHIQRRRYFFFSRPLQSEELLLGGLSSAVPVQYHHSWGFMWFSALIWRMGFGSVDPGGKHISYTGCIPLFSYYASECEAAHPSFVNLYHMVETYLCLLLIGGNRSQGLAWCFLWGRWGFSDLKVRAGWKGALG